MVDERKLMDEQMSVSPASYVIGKLGGLTRTADELNLAVSTVQGWKKRGSVPQKYWVMMIHAGKDRGVELALTDFLESHPADGATQ